MIFKRTSKYTMYQGMIKSIDSMKSPTFSFDSPIQNTFIEIG